VADLVSGGGPRVALVGCGSIAAHHVAALRHAGCEVASVTARPSSERAPRFAAEHGIPIVHPDLPTLLADAGWDAAVVAAPPEATLGLVIQLAATGRPVLVEKPGALHSRDLDVLRPWDDQLLFGYNRRFYEPVARAAALLSEHGPSLVELVLPEPGGAGPAEAGERLLTNGTHGLDLVQHLVGPVTVLEVDAPTTGVARGGVARSERGDRIHVLVAWDSPDNARLTLHWPHHRYELRPFEVGRAYHGMQVTEPGPGSPVRAYTPLVVDEVVADAAGKPGFAGQARALVALVEGAPTGPAARLDDAIRALALAEALLSASPPR
jgi:predicted dehydrogenase